MEEVEIIEVVAKVNGEIHYIKYVNGKPAVITKGWVKINNNAEEFLLKANKISPLEVKVRAGNVTLKSFFRNGKLITKKFVCNQRESRDNVEISRFWWREAIRKTLETFKNLKKPAQLKMF